MMCEQVAVMLKMPLLPQPPPLLSKPLLRSIC
jgi:hypothetical protein